MAIRLALIVMAVVLINDPLFAQSLSEGNTELRTAILERLGEIQKRLETIDKRLAVVESRTKNFPALGDFGIVPVKKISVGLLVPHFDEIRYACDAPELFLTADQHINALFFVTAPNASAGTSQRLATWIAGFESGKTSTATIDDSESLAPAPDSTIVPTQQEIKRRTESLKRMFPARYESIGEQSVPR